MRTHLLLATTLAAALAAAVPPAAYADLPPTCTVVAPDQSCAFDCGPQDAYVVVAGTGEVYGQVECGGGYSCYGEAFCQAAGITWGTDQGVCTRFSGTVATCGSL